MTNSNYDEEVCNLCEYYGRNIFVDSEGIIRLKCECCCRSPIQGSEVFERLNSMTNDHLKLAGKLFDMWDAGYSIEEIEKAGIPLSFIQVSIKPEDIQSRMDTRKIRLL